MLLSATTASPRAPHPAPSAAKGPAETSAATAADLVDVSTLDPRFVIDMRYATTDNFTHTKLYDVARCLLRRKVGAMVVAAQHYLDAHHPGYVLMFKDCYRPVSVQKRMWKVVAGTPMRHYVANPYTATGSVHNYGAAVDLTLSKDGHEVDMGAPFDYLGDLAQPRYEERYVKEGKLTRQQVANRLILRDAMLKGGGFHMIHNEWWHFNAMGLRELRATYKKLDVPLSAVPGGRGHSSAQHAGGVSAARH